MLTVALACGAAELGLRAVHGAWMARAAEKPGRECVRASAVPELIYEYTPDRCGANARGWPDREHAIPKPPGTFRVLVIGDSVAAGLMLADARASRFTTVLETALGRAHPGRALEVVTLARAGYSTSQELWVLEHEAAAYEPDLVVWSYVLNDPGDPFFHDVNGDLGKYFRRPASRLADLFGRAWFTLRERRLGRGCPTEYHRFLHCAYAADVQRNLGRVGAWSAERRVPIVLVIHALHPASHERAGLHAGAEFASYAQYPFADLHAAVAAVATRAGLIALDELAAYRDAPAASLSITGDVWHPNERGHALTGLWLAAQLDARGLLPH